MNHIRHMLTLAALLLVTGIMSYAKTDVRPDIVPYPKTLQMAKGTFKLSGTAINCDAAMDAESIAAVGQLAGQLTLVTGKTVAATTTPGLDRAVSAGKARGLVFILDRNLKAEQYKIDVGSKCAVVRASGRDGFLYAIQTLKQLMPVEIYGRSAASGVKWVIPCVSIDDQPQYGWRGMHLDCARHFFSTDEVKRYLDLMAIYKYNRFHWHLTDDQGWRIEILRYPELTQIGAYRDGSQYGHKRDEVDDIRYGGYYTQEQIKDIVAYADRLGIEVVPEIDLPGHMQAVIATYPELGCTGGPYEVRKTWGVAEDVLCGGKDASYEFLRNVLEEVADLFPCKYFHIGGDECPKVRWEKCPDCQAKIAALGLKGDPTRKNAGPEWALQSYITNFVSDVLAAKGKQIIGWDEIRYGGTKGGEIIMSWLGMSKAREAVEDGLRVIVCPHPYCYLNYYQAKPVEKEPIAIGGYIKLQKVYDFDPFKPLETRKPESYIPAQYKGQVLGVQANLWTEFVTSDAALEYQLLPRMLAMSEVQWRDPAVKDYQDFRERVIARHLPMFDIMGYNYCKDVLEK